MDNIKSIIDEVEKIGAIYEKSKGIEREFSPFVAVVQDNLDILITSISGFSVIYPAYSATWIFMIKWISSWDESDRTNIENFIKGIVFPCSMRLSDIDSEYFNDIMSAHERLTGRLINKKNNNGQEN